MNELFESMRHSWTDPVTRHAILVHTPIVIGVLAVPFVAALLFLGRRPAIWYRVILGVILFGTAVIAWQGTEAGEAAATVVEARLETEAARDVLAEHAGRGERIPLLLAGVSVLVFSTLARPRGVKLAAGLAATASILGTAALIVVTAHEGGLLVYRFGAAQASSSEMWIAPRSVDGLDQLRSSGGDDRLPPTSVPVRHLAVESVRSARPHFSHPRGK